MPKAEKKKKRKENRDAHRKESDPYEEGEVEEVVMNDATTNDGADGGGGGGDDDDQNDTSRRDDSRKKQHSRHSSNKDDRRRKKTKHDHHHRSREDHPKPHRHRNQNDDTSPCSTFDEMNLKPDLLKGIYAYGFEKPSAIQQRAIRPIVRGRDVIAQSQSGTGKTAVFSISSLQLLDSSSRDVQVLVLSPTRELAEQSQKVMQSLGDFMNVRSFGRSHPIRCYDHLLDDPCLTANFFYHPLCTT